MKKPSIERIEILNKGLDEAKNLMESLAIDFSILLSYTLSHFKMPVLPSKCGITQKMHLIAEAIYQQTGMDDFEFMATHPSDTLRSLSCYLLRSVPLPFTEKLNQVRPLADDPNSGVREWAWLALRPELILNLEDSLTFLTDWVTHSSPRIRRYACEITRPRGVWCAHIPILRKSPEKALSILVALKDDPERYVQLSVGNWLNDAGKDHPEWVMNLCLEWLESAPTPQTLKICKRGVRNLDFSELAKYYPQKTT